MKTKKILKEQNQTQNNSDVNSIESQKNELKTRLESYVNKGCAPNGIVTPMSSKNPQYSYSIKQESSKTPGKFRYLYEIRNEDGTLKKRIAEVNDKGKLTLTDKLWDCDIDLTYTEKQSFKRQTKTPQQENAIKTYLNAGWLDKGGIINPAEVALYDTLQMRDEYPDLFTDSYILVIPKESVDTNQLINELKNLVNTKNFGDRKTCRQIISKYNMAKQKDAPINDAVLKSWKSAVNSCDTKIDNFNDLGITKKLLKILKSDSTNQRWLLSNTQSVNNTQDTQSNVNETHLRLKNSIRENISKINESKNASLLQEGKIINNRFNIITEGTTPKNKKDQKKVGKELFNEMIYLNKQGYSQELISEGLFDIFSGIFPKGVSEPIMQYFKEEAAKWLAGKFGLDSNSWISSIIISAIGNLNIGDISKLTDCNFVTKLLSKSIAEGVLRKIQTEKFGDSAFYNLMRNTLVDALEATELATKLEEKLGTIICPLVSTLSGKMEGAADTMKQKALGAV